MINQDEFVRLITEYRDYQKHIDILESVLGPFDSPMVDAFYKMFDRVLNLQFTEIEIDHIMWWLCERDHDRADMWDSKGNVIPTETIDDLWNIVKSERI